MLTSGSLLTRTESAALVGVFLLVRLGMLIAFFKLTGGNEIASDVYFHKLIIDQPLGILAGTSYEISSYPPFQWLVEWPLYNLFAIFFHKFLSIRLLMLTVELLAFSLLVYQSRHFFDSKKMLIATAVLFIIAPVQYFSTVFFVQEDIISQLFILLATLALLKGYRELTMAILVLGVLIAKIFFIIPLFYVIWFHGNHTFFKRVTHGLLSIAPIVLVYFITITNALNNGGDVPIRDFTPDADYAANFWVLILKADPDALTTVKHASLLLSAAVQFLVIGIFFFYKYVRKKTLHPLVLIAVPLVFFFGTFYQHMPEYFLMLWPVTALLCTSLFQHLLLAFAFSLAWAPRVIHGIKTIQDNFGSTVEARADILKPLLDLLQFDMNTLHSASLAAQTFFYTVMMIYLCFLAIGKNRSVNTLQQ